jgi:alanine or glycine:cation symporter, AGCS family
MDRAGMRAGKPAVKSGTRLLLLSACLLLAPAAFAQTDGDDATTPAAPAVEAEATPELLPAETSAEPAPVAESGTDEVRETGTTEKTSDLNVFMDEVFGAINAKLGAFLFFDVAAGSIEIEEVDASGEVLLDPETGLARMRTVGVPLIVFVLGFGALFFTIWFRFINIRGFLHSVNVTRGKYDDPNDMGEISHFRALTSALSATVGLGNIAGVAIAIQMGGPGAVFWMMLAAVFGMSVKFSSCTLSQLFRQVNPDGTISGGPMYYLDLGLRRYGPVGLVVGKGLALTYAVMVMGGALGGGNMFQANQSFEAMFSTFEWIDKDKHSWIFGLVMSVLVGLVVIGGIKRIGAATARIVPFMCGIYVLAALWIIFTNLSEVPRAASLIFTMAFTDNAMHGGLVGVLVMGVRRAAFSNEAGLGSSAIAHAAAKTDEPVREGFVAMMEPFVDTIIVCMMTASVVIITGAYNDPDLTGMAGVAITKQAFRSQIEWFPYVLTLCILLFAYSTMISWCYFGERGWIYLFDHFGGAGLRTVVVFRLIFVAFVFLGAVTNLAQVIDFADLMILSMAFPNIVGSILLAPYVLPKVQDYWRRYKSGEMTPDR